MKDVVTVRGRKYIRLDRVNFAAVESSVEWLMDDERFVEKVKRAYNVQVCLNNGWGFTVRHEGYRIRFDLSNATGYKLPKIYEGHAEEKPETVQTKLLEVVGLRCVESGSCYGTSWIKV
ncbi:MAG: hypothetical protein QXR45_16540 [Candidatus Bathyarchaeia archaeon]